MQKKTILILGNSHGGEYFHLIQNTNYLTEKYNIIYSLIQIRCLKILLIILIKVIVLEN